MKKNITSYLSEAIDKSKEKYTLNDGVKSDETINVMTALQLIRDAFVAGVKWREDILKEELNKKRKL